MIAFEELKAAIKESGLSEYALAHRAQIQPVTIAHWMDGTVKSPHLETAVKVAAALGKHFELLNGVVRLTQVNPRSDRKPDRFTPLKVAARR